MARIATVIRKVCPKAILLVIKCVVRYKKYLSKFSSNYSILPLGNFPF